MRQKNDDLGTLLNANVRRAGPAWILRLALLLFGLWSAAAHAGDAPAPLLLDPAAGSVELGGAGHWWIDDGGRATIADVAAGAASWQPTAPGGVYPLRPGDALWLRFVLAEADHSERWYLEIPYAGVNRVTLHAGDGSQPLVAGDAVEVAYWPLPHRHPLLPLDLEPGQSHTYWLRVENSHAFGAPLVFTSERTLLREEQRGTLGLGIFFGLAGLAVLLAIPAAIWLRDRAIAWFAVMVTLGALSQASITGLGGLHLWPHLVWWNDMAPFLLPLAGVASLLALQGSVVTLRARSRRLHGLFNLLGLVCLATGALLPWLDPAWRADLMAVVVGLALLAGTGVTAWAALRGDRPALWMLGAMVPLALGAAPPLLRGMGLLPMNFWTQHALQFALALEVPLLMAPLLARSEVRREYGRRVAGLERTDPATGLINASVFHERLRRLLVRSERLRHHSVVLLVDIVNVEQVRRDFDSRSAQELPLLVAGRLLSAAREIDSVARLDEYRFGMLIEGPVSAADMAANGPRVVARCLMPYDGKPVACVPQVRVAQAAVPLHGVDADGVLRRLAGVLAAVPADSRRAVFTLN
jgi:GGDEF domain-containing protein